MRLDQLTVAVPTKNEAANIAGFLASLAEGVSLIVVDASTDDTRDRIAAARTERTQVIYDTGTIPAARQIALDACTTEWILFTDADMAFGEGYWAEWERLVLSPAVGAVQGAKLSADDDFRTYYRLFSFGIRAASWLTIPAGSGSNMLFRARALREAGGFDLALTANEDIFALWTVRKAGWRVPYAGGLKVYERDHRRLIQGRAKKTLHSWARSVMLFTGIGAESVRTSSWGYWKDDAGRSDADARLTGHNRLVLCAFCFSPSCSVPPPSRLRRRSPSRRSPRRPPTRTSGRATRWASPSTTSRARR